MARDPIEQVIRALLDRERLANSLTAQEIERVERLFRDIEDMIRRSNPPGPSAARYQRLRTERLLRDIRAKLREFSPELSRSLKDALAEIGRRQAEQAQAGLIATIGTSEGVTVGITQQRLRAIMNTDPFRGRLLSEHAEAWSDAQYKKIRDQIRLGMTNEESIDDIVRRVRGRQAGFIRRDPKTGAFVPKGTRGAVVTRRFRGGVLQGSRNDIEALVRTSVTHISNVGAEATYQANKDVVKAMEFVATLDDRTTVVCIEYDGTVWPLDSGDIQRPPLHYSCRSILVPVVDWEGLGIDPPESGTRIARDMSTVSDEDLARKVSARRRTGDFGKVTKVSSNLRATEWLRNQRPSVQNKILGTGAAKRFRAGELTVSDMVRGDNTVRPLRELLDT